VSSDKGSYGHGVRSSCGCQFIGSAYAAAKQRLSIMKENEKVRDGKGKNGQGILMPATKKTGPAFQPSYAGLPSSFHCVSEHSENLGSLFTGASPERKSIVDYRYFAGGNPPSYALLRISLASIIRKQNQIRRSLSRERFSERRTPSDSFEESLRQDATNFKFRSTESNFFVVFSLKDVVSGNPVSSPGRPADAAFKRIPFPVGFAEKAAIGACYRSEGRIDLNNINSVKFCFK
jgi:hypothetical protein